MPAILFDVTRTGDLSKPGSVTWALEGDLQDADLATGQLKTDTLIWAANEATAKTVTINTVGNTVDNPDRTCRIRLSAPGNGVLGTDNATTTITDDDTPVSVGEACTRPRLGSIRTAAKQVVLYHHDRPLTDPSYTSLLPVMDIMTKIVYTGNDFNIPTVFDHSPAGIRTFAGDVYRAFIRRLGNETQARMMWWDWEETTSAPDRSINIPASITAGWTTGYDAARDKYHAAFYELGVPPNNLAWGTTQAHADELRVEAARFGSELAREICALADAASGGLREFEQMSYTHPDIPGSGASWPYQAAHINRSWMCPWMVGGGQSCYFTGSPAVMEANKANPRFWTDGFANNVRSMRSAFGAKFKIIPTIWARWNSSDKSGSNYTNTALYPNSSFCVPAGFISTLVNAVFNAGADGVTIFGSGDVTGASGSLATQYNARYKELADYMTAHRSEFVGVRY